jgi:DNA-binding beta-propeller fold protein YncE
VADSSVGLSNPRDLNFHPLTGALWVANSHTDGILKLDVNQLQVNQVNAPMIIAGSFKTDRAHYHYMVTTLVLHCHYHYMVTTW